MNDIIRLENVKRCFKVGSETINALKNITLQIKEGEFVSIMGTSGSGKSTLLNILGCLDTLTEGFYYLDGVEVNSMTKNERAKLRNRKIGFVFQSYNLLARTNAIENVELPLMYNPDMTSKMRREKAIEALEAVGLKDRMKHTPNQLSGGQQQRIAIARALVNDPVIILADEATGNLDSRTSYEIMALLQNLHEQGKTIAFVTHESEIALFGTRSIVLRDGLVIKDEKVSNRMFAEEILKTLPEDDNE